MSAPTGRPPGPDGAEVVDAGTECGVSWATRRAPIFGAVNGYVEIPEGHPWSGMGYEEIGVEVHGGLTYSDGRCVGFDAMHSGDWWPGMGEFLSRVEGDLQWTPEAVACETRELALKVAQAGAVS